MDKLSASEALFGFVGWLTSREEITVMSRDDDAAVIADLVDEFCQENSLAEPRPDWNDNLSFPPKSRQELIDEAHNHNADTENENGTP